MKKIITYCLYIVIIGLVGYNAIYFKKLSDVKKASIEKFDAKSFSQKLWEEKMPAKINSAVDLNVLIKAVTADKESALNKYSNALGIGNYRYALIKTNATVYAVNEDEVILQLPANDTAILTTEYIYGNAIRDASALIDVTDFPNTDELNSISEEMNKIVRSNVLPAFKKSIKKGQQIQLIAAVEINKAHIKWNGLELLPVQIQIVK